MNANYSQTNEELEGGVFESQREEERMEENGEKCTEVQMLVTQRIDSPARCYGLHLSSK